MLSRIRAAIAWRRGWELSHQRQIGDRREVGIEFLEVVAPDFRGSGLLEAAKAAKFDVHFSARINKPIIDRTPRQSIHCIEVAQVLRLTDLLLAAGFAFGLKLLEFVVSAGEHPV